MRNDLKKAMEEVAGKKSLSEIDKLLGGIINQEESKGESDTMAKNEPKNCTLNTKSLTKKEVESARKTTKKEAIEAIRKSRSFLLVTITDKGEHLCGQVCSMGTNADVPHMVEMAETWSKERIAGVVKGLLGKFINKKD